MKLMTERAVKRNRKRIKISAQTRIFNLIAIVVLLIASGFCVLPFILIITGSLTSETSIVKYGYRLIPGEWSLAAYKSVLAYPQTILRAYGVTIVNTLTGSGLGLMLIAMTGYVLSRKDFLYRNQVSFLIYFTTLFGGGLVPFYIIYTRALQLMNSYIAICLPLLMSPFLIILMRTFITDSVPDAVVESAKIDGAGHMTTFLLIVMPIITPGLATVGLFLGLSYWSSWYFSSLFIQDQTRYELQYYLYKILSGAQAAQMLRSKGVTNIPMDLPNETLKLAMTVIVTGPILLLYPFIQRYFVSGITIGAVKG